MERQGDKQGSRGVTKNALGSPHSVLTKLAGRVALFVSYNCVYASYERVVGVSKDGPKYRHIREGLNLELMDYTITECTPLAYIKRHFTMQIVTHRVA